MRTTLALTTIIIAGFACAQTPDYVPTDNLQGWWSFSGSANDVSGNGHHGTIYGATLTADRFGTANRAYYFDGTDYIWTAYNAISGSNPRTVSFWAQTTNSVAEMSGVSWGANQPGARFGCHFNINATGVTADMAYSHITYAPAGFLFDGSWHHFVFQSGNSNLAQVKIYMDGTLLTQSVHTTNVSTPINTMLVNPLTFGKACDQSAYFFNGKLDDIGIWDRVLVHEEIQALYTGVPVGISEQNVTLFSISPNPVKDQLTIHFSDQMTGRSSVTVYALDGKQLLSYESQPDELSIPFVLDVQRLSAGVYLLQLSSEKGNQQLNFIKE